MLGRRYFLKRAVQGVLSSLLASQLLLNSRKSFAGANLFLPQLRPEDADSNQGESTLELTHPFERMSPVEALSFEEFLVPHWRGDPIDRPHEVLWDPEGFLREHGGIPESKDGFDVVIIGGGISGLTAATELSQYRVLLLEASPQMGGNSKGVRVGPDITHSEPQVLSLGAAYFCEPTPQSRMEIFLNSINVINDSRRPESENTVLGVPPRLEQAESLWKESPANQRLHEELTLLSEKEFPTIPLNPSPGPGEMEAEKIRRLDQISFSRWIQDHHPDLTPHLREFLELYCWSSFGATADALSSVQVLNFLCADLLGIRVLPGGNAEIAARLLRRLEAQPSVQIRASALVFKIFDLNQGTGKKPEICVVYLDQTTPDSGTQKVMAVRARQVLFTGPKSYAKVLIDEIPREQRQAMEKLNSQPYLVGNCILSTEVSPPPRTPGVPLEPGTTDLYDTFLLKGMEDALKLADSRATLQFRGFTDFVAGGFATRRPTRALTLYRPLPYSGARQFLFNPTSYSKHQELMTKEVKQLLPALGLDPSKVTGIQLTRWGHALPTASVGLLASEVCQTASRTLYQGHLHFSGQDNWANPSFETAVETAWTAADQIRQSLTAPQ